jgi:hypothetical protein
VGGKITASVPRGLCSAQNRVSLKAFHYSGYTNRCMKRQTMRKILFLFLLIHCDMVMGQTIDNKLLLTFQNLPIFESPEKIMEESGIEFTPFMVGSLGRTVHSFMGDLGEYKFSDIEASESKLLVSKEVKHNRSSYNYSVAIVLLIDDHDYAQDCYWNLLFQFEEFAWKIHTRTKVNESEETLAEATMMIFDKNRPIKLLLSIEDSDKPEYRGKKAITIKFDNEK